MGTLKLFCPLCGADFIYTPSTDGKSVGGIGGALAGAALGSQIGIAGGPLGAIAGTVPGALLGFFFGSSGGKKLDDPECPHCKISFSIKIPEHTQIKSPPQPKEEIVYINGIGSYNICHHAVSAIIADELIKESQKNLTKEQINYGKASYSHQKIEQLSDLIETSTKIKETEFSEYRACGGKFERFFELRDILKSIDLHKDAVEVVKKNINTGRLIISKREAAALIKLTEAI